VPRHGKPDGSDEEKRPESLSADSSGLPAAWRNGLATLISPAVGLNRMMFYSRFGDAFADQEPNYCGRLRIGATHAVQHSFDTPVGFKVDGTTID